MYRPSGAPRLGRVAVDRRVARAERPSRVEDDVVGQHPDLVDAGGRVLLAIELVHALQVVHRHADEPHVAEVLHGRLEAADARDAPAARQRVEDRVHVAAEPLAAAERQHPVRLELERVADRGVAGHRDVGPRAAEAEAVELRSALERVLIVQVRGEALRQAAPQLELQRVVLAERAAVGHVGVVHVRVDDEEVRRVSSRLGLVSARQVVVQIRRRAVGVRVRPGEAAGDRRVRVGGRGIDVCPFAPRP